MKRALLLYDVTFWAYWRRAKALQKYAPPDWTIDVALGYGNAMRKHDYDVILQLYFSNVHGVRAMARKLDRRAKIVCGYNTGWKGAFPPRLARAMPHSDLVILNNRDLYDRIHAMSPKLKHISNGVDLDEFRVTVPPAERQFKIISQASLFHRVTKGYPDILVPLEKELDKMGIAHDFRLVNSTKASTQLRGQALVDWYNSGTVYVVASKFEGTPNPALEAAACGCTVVATPVGNMPELIDGTNGVLVERKVAAFVAAIAEMRYTYIQWAAAMQTTIQGWHWRDRALEYFRLFDEVSRQ